MPPVCMYTGLVKSISAQILIGSCIHFDLLSYVDKKGHLNDGTGLQLCRLGPTRLGVSTQPRVGIHHFQHHCVGEIHTNHLHPIRFNSPTGSKTSALV